MIAPHPSWGHSFERVFIWVYFWPSILQRRQSEHIDWNLVFLVLLRTDSFCNSQERILWWYRKPFTLYLHHAKLQILLTVPLLIPKYWTIPQYCISEWFRSIAKCFTKFTTGYIKLKNLLFIISINPLIFSAFCHRIVRPFKTFQVCSTEGFWKVRKLSDKRDLWKVLKGETTLWTNIP